MIKQMLMSSNYWVLNKSIVKEFGIETAFILTNLVEAENILADEDGWFYQTADTLEVLTGMSNHKQTVAIKQLIDCGVIAHKNKGIPMKRYFKISFQKIEELAFKNIKNCSLKNCKTSIEEISNNKEITNKKIKKEMKINYADNVKMLEVEYTKLITQYTKTVIDEKIIDLSLWKGSKGKNTKSDYLTLLTWLRKDTKTNTPVKEDTWGGMKQFN